MSDTMDALLKHYENQENMSNDLYDDLVDNPTSRCPCILVLDVSGSMAGEPIEELNNGVKLFIETVLEDDFASYAVDVGVITFGRNVNEIIPIQSVQNLDPPNFYAAGVTPMGEAVNKAIATLEKRKKEYKKSGISYYQPWLILMTDGVPTDRYQEAAAKLRKLADNNKMVAIVVGIGNQCDLQLLSEFCASNNPPKRLSGLKFSEFFKWLSQSVGEVITKSTPGVVFQPSKATDGWEVF